MISYFMFIAIALACYVVASNFELLKTVWANHHAVFESILGILGGIAIAGGLLIYATLVSSPTCIKEVNCDDYSYPFGQIIVLAIVIAIVIFLVIFGYKMPDKKRKKNVAHHK